MNFHEKVNFKSCDSIFEQGGQSRACFCGDVMSSLLKAWNPSSGKSRPPSAPSLSSNYLPLCAALNSLFVRRLESLLTWREEELLEIRIETNLSNKGVLVTAIGIGVRSFIILRHVQSRKKSLYMVRRMLQASWGRRGKQQQEQNLPNHKQRLFWLCSCWRV